MCHACIPGSLSFSHSNFDIDELHTHASQTPAALGDAPITLFHGGSIITMAGGSFSPVEALVTGGPGGRILYTGPLEGAKEVAGDKAKLVDLGTRCLLPGFVEPHLHIIMSSLMGTYFVDVNPLNAPTSEEAVRLLKERVPEVSAGAWLPGYGYDPSRVEGHAELTAEMLDSVSETIPILVMNASGHIAYVNHKAFAIAGVDDSTPDPPGGEFVRDEEGHLTGAIVEASAIEIFAKFLTPPAALKLLAGIQVTLKKWAGKGCTTIFDAGVGLVSPGTYIDLLLLSSSVLTPGCPVRITGALTSELATFVRAEEPPYKAGTLKFRSIKLWTDGSTQGFTGAVREPYLNDGGWGLLNSSDTELRRQMGPWQKLGWQLVVHANADRAIDQTLGAFDAILDHKPDPNVIHRIDHMTVTVPEQIASAKALGLGVSHTLGHVYYWGDTFRTWVLGSPRADRIDPVADDAKNGVLFSFHSDSPVSEVNPLLHVRTAVTRRLYGMDTDPNGVLGPDQCVDLETALRGITINAAKHVMLGDEVGSLEVGKSADLVLLEKDPRQVDSLDLHKIKVEQTWLRGRVVWSAEPTK